MILGVTVRDSSRCKPFGRKPLGVNGRADSNYNDDDDAVGPTAPTDKPAQVRKLKPKEQGDPPKPGNPSRQIQTGKPKPSW